MHKQLRSTGKLKVQSSVYKSSKQTEVDVRMGQANSLPNTRAAACLKPLRASFNHNPTV